MPNLLHLLIKDEDSDVILRWISRYPGEINMYDRYGATPLVMAAQKGYLDIVNALLGAGADIHLTWRGHTPFELAARRGRTKTVQLLAQHPEATCKMTDGLPDEPANAAAASAEEVTTSTPEEREKLLRIIRKSYPSFQSAAFFASGKGIDCKHLVDYVEGKPVKLTKGDIPPELIKPIDDFARECGYSGIYDLLYALRPETPSRAAAPG